MKNTFYLILILFMGFLHSCQKEKISDIYNKCYSENVTIDGKSIKHYIKGFENELIRSKLLKDSTGESYKNLFFEISEYNYDYIYLETQYSFLDSIKGLKIGEAVGCASKVKNHIDFEKSIFGKMGTYMKQNDGNHEGFFESQFTDIFNEKTFEYDYIKHRLFSFLKIYDKKNKSNNGNILCKTKNCPPERKTIN